MTGRLRAAGCVFAEEEARLLVDEGGTATQLAAMVEARASGMPLEYALGWAEFCGLRVAVEPGVFVPRRRTEFLVDQAVSGLFARREGAAEGGRPAVVLDICSGSGALGLAVAVRVAGVELHAVDIDPVAVGCERRNLAAVGVEGSVYVGDLFAPLPGRLHGQADLVLANVPYVPTGEIGLLPVEAREHEALTALDGGRDGLDVMRRVADEVPRWLAPDGFVLVETSRHQADSAAAAFAAAGLSPDVVTSDESSGGSAATVVVASLPPRRR